jgi:hypothetical protein
MPSRIDGDTVVGDTPQCVFRPGDPFRRVVDTLPDDTAPDALVLIGLLTGHLRPTSEAAARRSQALVASGHEPPAVTVSEQTVTAFQ